MLAQALRQSGPGYAVWILGMWSRSSQNAFEILNRRFWLSFLELVEVIVAGDFVGTAFRLTCNSGGLEHARKRWQSRTSAGRKAPETSHAGRVIDNPGMANSTWTESRAASQRSPAIWQRMRQSVFEYDSLREPIKTRDGRLASILQAALDRPDGRSAVRRRCRGVHKSGSHPGNSRWSQESRRVSRLYR